MEGAVPSGDAYKVVGVDDSEADHEENTGNENRGDLDHRDYDHEYDQHVVVTRNETNDNDRLWKWWWQSI